MNIKERFLKYVSFDTQSDPQSTTTPSSKNQLILAEYLKDELMSLGVPHVELDSSGIVYATIPSNNGNKGDIIGLIAHMDTSPDASCKDIQTQIIEDYQWNPIVLNQDKKLVLDPQEFPDLSDLINHTLITTDGTTLLGADDKAGVAIIVQVAQYILQHHEFKHNDIQIAFTPDEEVGRGTDCFNVQKFHADYAYTIDGGNIAEL